MHNTKRREKNKRKGRQKRKLKQKVTQSDTENHRVNELDRIQNLSMRRARNIRRAATLGDENAVEARVEIIAIETGAGAVHQLTKPNQKKLIETHIKTDTKNAVAVLLIDMIIFHPHHEVSAQETINTGKTTKNRVHQTIVRHRTATVQLTLCATNVRIIKNRRKNTRRSHRKSTTVPKMTAISRRKLKKVNVKDLDRRDDDKFKSTNVFAPNIISIWFFNQFK